MKEFYGFYVYTRRCLQREWDQSLPPRLIYGEIVMTSKGGTIATYFPVLSAVSIESVSPGCVGSLSTDFGTRDVTDELTLAAVVAEGLGGPNDAFDTLGPARESHCTLGGSRW
jgi:hypothetical protein